MITVENARAKEFPFALHVGEVAFPMSAEDLKNLHSSLSTCRDQHALEPTCRVRVIAPWYSPPEEERDEKRNRASLWVEDRKWRISNHEEIDLHERVKQLTADVHKD